MIISAYTKEVKCIVWDLDDTIWDGTLTEPAGVRLKPEIRDIIIKLDARGILHSIASKNNYDDVIQKLKQFEMDQYFLYPQIGWNAKSASITNIQKSLNIGFDTIVFVDDQQFELEEVSHTHADVECLHASNYLELPSLKRLNPRFITEDSVRRRILYLEDSRRVKDENEFKGPEAAFLATLNMELTITEAKKEDLKRAEELTIRTNQLNATGKTYDYDELDRFRKSDRHKLLVCELKDKYGSYGKICLALVEITDTHWHLKMLLVSCRVISRGIGTTVLSVLQLHTKREGKKLWADFVQTDRNRMMYITYRFSNFHEVSNDGKGNILFENDLAVIQQPSSFINVTVKFKPVKRRHAIVDLKD